MKNVQNLTLFCTGGQPAPSTANNNPSTTSSTTTTTSSTDFQPDRPIGYGAFGVVWSVTDPRDGKRVALKKLPNVFQSLVSSNRNGANRFCRENKNYPPPPSPPPPLCES